MNRFFSGAVAMLAVALSSYAQTGVIRSYPGHDGRSIVLDSLYSAPAKFRPGRVSHQFPQEKAPLEAVLSGRSLYYAGSDGVRHVVAESESPEVTYGQSVSRNEFGIDGGVFWSPDYSKLAFYRKDESMVAMYPLLDIGLGVNALREIKYPMNGQSSEKVSLGIFDVATGRVCYADVTDFGEDRYLTGVSWSLDGKFVYIGVLSRSQHELHLNMYSAEDGAFVKTVLTEENDAWVEPYEPLHFLRDGLFIYSTDNRDGYKNLYLVDNGGSVRRLVDVDADIEYAGHNGSSVFYTSAEDSPAENHLFRVDVKPGKSVKVGKPVRLTMEPGWHDVVLDRECKLFRDSYSSTAVPGEVNIRSTKDGRVVEHLLSSADPFEEYEACEVLYGAVKSADGEYYNNYRIVRPHDFDPSKKYPVILYVYGGPHGQTVRDTWLADMRPWEIYMAGQGYVLYIQNNRGNPRAGAAYEKAINRQCGKVEMEDQMAGLRMLMEEPWVDRDRIGVHGWSYGGFMTISLMTHYPEVFKVGVAGGPVIDWRWYEIMYGERYMDTLESNPEGFAATSLLAWAPALRGKLLICQGAIDDTVVWSHSLSFVQACIDAGVQVDYFPYPVDPHNVRGPRRAHLMTKVTNYFEDYL